MSPDYMYFILPPPSLRHAGHTSWGLVLFCIPAGLAVLYAFHRFFKRPLVLLLPHAVRAKLWPHCGRYRLLPLRRLIRIATLIFLGAVTHVVWDGLTHEYVWALWNYPQRQAVMITLAGQDVYWCDFLQHGSSLFGLGLVAWWSWQWYLRAPAGWAPADSPFLRRARGAIAAAMIVFGAGVGILFGLAYACKLPGPLNVGEFLRVAFIIGIDAFGLALLVFAAAMKMRDWKTARAVGEADRYRLLRNLGSATVAAKSGDKLSHSKFAQSPGSKSAAGRGDKKRQ